MKRSKIIGIILLVLSIVSLPIGFSLSCIIGEADIFGTAGIIRYSWIMLLFIPICILSMLYGKHLKNNGLSYKANYIVAIVCMIFLLIIGSYRFFTSNSYDTNKLTTIEKKLNFDLPDNVKIATTDFEQYDICYVKILDETEKNHFENEIKNNSLWTNKMSDTVIASLPINIHLEAKNLDYFIVCDVTTQEYNPSTLYHNCEFIFIAYNNEIGQFIIFDGYRV